VNFDEFTSSIDRISEKLSDFERKPIVELKIHGENIETEQIQTQISRLNLLTLRCFWRIITKDVDSSVLLERPSVIDDELLRLSTDALGSEKAANFAVKELLPLLASNRINEAAQIVIENYENYKKEKK